MKNIISSLTILGITTTILGSSSFAQTSEIEEFHVVGNEPFWDIKIEKTGIVYQALDQKTQYFPYFYPLSAQGRPIDQVRVYQLRGKRNNMLILNRVESCSDTMSEKNYPYSATLIMGNQVFDGCAEKKIK
ncbi:MAG: hypothetical protein F6K62_08690 [Sphaerospermopsis sp. SIO1G2]|nr:hypothetical protein [Sphaerospermopsis sp. SIO1G1]NET71006.1 hypothetical protein [Sphaerospermopsis sp. SIO1G2]